jgi:hypothetical protein
MHSYESSDGVPCCDCPDLETKYYPTVACRACGSIWDEDHSSQTGPHAEGVAVEAVPLAA